MSGEGNSIEIPHTNNTFGQAIENTNYGSNRTVPRPSENLDGEFNKKVLKSWKHDAFSPT
jgi:hypothetical protein